MTVPVSQRSIGQDVAWVSGVDRVALLNLSRCELPPLILEGSSAVIWQLIADGIEENALVDKVAQHYDVAATDVQGAVTDFLSRLDALGLLEPGSRR